MSNQFVDIVESEFGDQYGTRMFTTDDGLVSFNQFIREYFGHIDELPDDVEAELDTWVADVLADNVA